ncbi:xylulokinase [Malassezia nana]|uniref:Xylulose kinase n=1 Tax=Malassezia nana TaxID=180528 RepID=A0AAF0EPH6_9BASI|nr:xylulokinase [Malassezia nana]
MGSLFLGLDLSTQALKATLLDEQLCGIDEVHVRFDIDLARFGTQSGILPKGHPLLDEPEAACSPASMYLAAIDRLWERISNERKWPIDRIAAISAAGQQHASVYLATGAVASLRNLSSDQTLEEQLHDSLFSRSIVPNWQDATTLPECAELMRGADECGTPLCATTGSIAHTRFTAAQILRWRRHHPDQYARTEHIQLVSNFVATMLTAGSEARVAPLDQSDACGMNLWDIQAGQWSEPLLTLVDGTNGATLAAKLGEVARDPSTPVARIGTWWHQRYGLRPDCLVCQSTGDNPATLQCLTPSLGEAVLSLGTSDTVLLPSTVYEPDPQYHTFQHPVSSLGTHSETPPYFLMLVYKNGSLAREWVRDTYCDAQWAQFDAALRAYPVPTHGTGFYWLQPEILPWDARGVHRFDATGAPIKEFEERTYNAPAIVQSQCMAFRTRIERILASSGTTLSRVYVVGGAADNATLCQLLAHGLNCEIARPVIEGRSANSNEVVPYNFCSVGAAFRARWVWECATNKQVSIPGHRFAPRGASGRVLGVS